MSSGYKLNPREVLVLLVTGAVLAFLVFASIAFAERPGDTVELRAFCRDSLGVAVSADSARLFVYRDTTLVESSKTIGDGITLGQTLSLKTKYTIPAATPDSARFSFWIRAKADDILDYYPCTPHTIEMHAGTVDSISPAAVVDLYVGDSDSTFAVIDSSDGGGIYSSGTPVTGAMVFVSSDAAMTNKIGFGKSTLGQYHITVPLDPVAADTMYVSAWYQNTWVRASTMVTQ